MALNTNINLRNLSVYQVFTRQHSQTQDFKGIIKDLDRIKAMGFDIIYLLPFHPIGKVARKGNVGSPYSIINYYEIDPLHGNLDDFINLKNEISKRNMKLMIDIVFNHTSRDSDLLKNNPELFYKNDKGEFANRIGDWSDITDLDFTNKEVWDYLINVLKYWSKYVDGFRCDVAPLVPLTFWEKAKNEVSKVNNNLIWLTESVEPGFIKYIRDMGYDAFSDSEMYQVFDVCYDYDIFKAMDDYLYNKKPLSNWLYHLNLQETIYPKNYVKLRSFENHDQDRIAHKASSEKQVIHLTAMQFFIKGMPMVYAGQEHLIKKRPDLFENDLIKWNNDKSIEQLITKLNEIKKAPIMSAGIYNLEDDENAIFSYTYKDTYLLGLFNLDNKSEIKTNLKDGTYINLLNNKEVIVEENLIKDFDYPIIIQTKQ
ncbi:MAG TPA: alpha-amylase [Acholeplasmataceae bacterium]|nr:alpha-amylase [Acholeplasmataceae bacterium]